MVLLGKCRGERYEQNVGMPPREFGGGADGDGEKIVVVILHTEAENLGQIKWHTCLSPCSTH